MHNHSFHCFILFNSISPTSHIPPKSSHNVDVYQMINPLLTSVSSRLFQSFNLDSFSSPNFQSLLSIYIRTELPLLYFAFSTTLFSFKKKTNNHQLHHFHLATFINICTFIMAFIFIFFDLTCLSYLSHRLPLFWIFLSSPHHCVYIHKRTHFCGHSIHCFIPVQIFSQYQNSLSTLMHLHLIINYIFHIAFTSSRNNLTFENGVLLRNIRILTKKAYA